MDRKPAKKDILIHLGPHKTGTSAIQKSLIAHSQELEHSGVFFLRSKETHKASLDLAQEHFEDAEKRLSQISKTIASLPQETIVMSHEDFSGTLIGRSGKRGVYPKLTKNLRILSRALRPHSVRFVFFVRQEANWLRSCYHQHLKYRSRFHSFADFSNYFEKGFCWSQKLEKPKEVFGANLVVLEYKSDPKAGISRLLELLPLDATSKSEFPFFLGENKSPTSEQISQLERVNEMTEFSSSAWFCKSWFLKGKKLAASSTSKLDASTWPPRINDTENCALPALLKRTNARVQAQSVEDILPPITVDLNGLAKERLPSEVAMPDLQRADIRNQSIILNYHLRGKSGLNHLNALVISYLRRDTPYTEKARTLFHRIWREQGLVLVNELSTRWLISTLQTFLDHGENEAQRSIGIVGFFYGNMMKIYEGERAIEGLEQNGSYSNLEPQTKNSFRGLDRYSVGGTDLMLNTNALALEIALRDEVAGLVLQEFLLRVKISGNVFSRHDRTRKINHISKSGFKDVWSFFEPWED